MLAIVLVVARRQGRGKDWLKVKSMRGMGFRGVGEFNINLLGKNLQRLLTREQTLTGRVFKARYYPRRSIMEAKFCFSQSYAWKSILSAQKRMQVGHRWRIGNGNKVRVWKDCRVPGQEDSKIKSPVRIIDQNVLVCDLIDQDMFSWKRDLLKSALTKGKQI